MHTKQDGVRQASDPWTVAVSSSKQQGIHMACPVAVKFLTPTCFSMIYVLVITPPQMIWCVYTHDARDIYQPYLCYEGVL